MANEPKPISPTPQTPRPLTEEKGLPPVQNPPTMPKVEPSKKQ